MSIVKKQFDKLVAVLSLLQLQEGRDIDMNNVRENLQDIIGERRGLPTVKYKPQKRKSAFDIEHFNSFFERFQFDVEIAYDEITDIVADTLMKLNTFELSYRSQSHQLNEIIDYLDSLLFTIDNAHGNFYGVFDNFQSTSKTNMDLSTKGVLDTREGCLSLPFNNTTGTKIKLNHLYQKDSWPIIISRDVLSSEHGSSAGFGNAFSDIYSPWRFDVVTSTPGPVTIQFDIPLSAISDTVHSLTRVQVIPHSSNPMHLQMHYTVDDVNFIVFPGTPETTTLDQESKTYNMDFISTQAEKVRFIVTKNGYDEENQDGNFIYTFGFKHIGFYSLGTALEGQYVSKALKPRGLAGNINRVSLVSSENIPTYCNAEYFVSLADSSDTQIGDWELIVPSNKPSSVPGDRVVAFRNNASKTREVHAPANLSALETHKSISFYELPIGIDSGDEHVFGSAQLFRGYGGWNRNINEDVVLRQVKDSYISFNGGDLQNIYAVISETAAVDSGFQTYAGGASSNTPVTKFTVTNPIDHRPLAGMSLVPAPDVNPIIDQRPDYSVYQIKRFNSQMSVTGELLTLTGITAAYFQNDILVTPSNEPTVSETGVQTSGPNSGQSLVYARDSDYILTLDAEGFIDGGIRRTVGSQISDGQIISADYGINPDITQNVDGIRDNVVYMKSLMNMAQDERIEIVYRFVPRGKNAIIRPTVKVTSKFGDEDQGELYREGPDFSININQGMITRIPSGDILPNQGDLAIYVDFYYKETPTDLHTYSTWVFQPSLDPVKIKYGDLGLDLDVGEKLILNSVNFTVDLSNSNETPFIPRGWHQIIVKSRDPAVFTNAAIKKIIELKDIDNEYVFIRGGNYFVDMQSVRSAMTEVTYDFLKNSVLQSNHSHFAVNSNKVMLNFQPGSTNELYNYQPTTDSNGDITGFDNQLSEDFVLKYDYKIPGQVEANKILVKIMLSKDRVADGGITPKVIRYNARIG